MVNLDDFRILIGSFILVCEGFDQEDGGAASIYLECDIPQADSVAQSSVNRQPLGIF